jgi:xanthine dehydrogenase accessory factor
MDVVVPLDATTLKDRPASQRNTLFAVIATQGDRDEEAVMEAIAAQPAYIGVVASRERFRQIRETLSATGVAAGALDSIRNPAGLDIHAKAPEEIALSILAEVVKERRAGAEVRESESPEVRESKIPRDPDARRSDGRTIGLSDSQTEIDPICGMTVEVAGARHTARHAGRTYYFCCGGCKQQFLAAPELHAARN